MTPVILQPIEAVLPLKGSDGFPVACDQCSARMSTESISRVKTNFGLSSARNTRDGRMIMLGNDGCERRTWVPLIPQGYSLDANHCVKRSIILLYQGYPLCDNVAMMAPLVAQNSSRPRAGPQNWWTGKGSIKTFKSCC